MRTTCVLLTAALLAATAGCGGDDGADLDFAVDAVALSCTEVIGSDTFDATTEPLHEVSETVVGGGQAERGVAWLEDNVPSFRWDNSNLFVWASMNTGQPRLNTTPNAQMDGQATLVIFDDQSRVVVTQCPGDTRFRPDVPDDGFTFDEVAPS